MRHCFAMNYWVDIVESPVAIGLRVAVEAGPEMGNEDRPELVPGWACRVRTLVSVRVPGPSVLRGPAGHPAAYPIPRRHGRQKIEPCPL